MMEAPYADSLERAAPALALALGQRRDRDAARVFVIARSQRVTVHGGIRCGG
jgi:hypothetical protein